MKEVFNKDTIKYLSLLGNVGFTIFLNIFVSIYAYKFFEKYFFKSLIIFVFFILIGIFNAFYSIYKTIMNKK